MTLPPETAAYQDVINASAHCGRAFTNISASSLRPVSGYHLTYGRFQ